MGRSPVMLCVLTSVAVIHRAHAEVINVPDPDNRIFTIQDGIDLAMDGDTVLVADGTYTGRGNVNLDFGSKAIAVKSAGLPSNCIIDCENTARFVCFGPQTQVNAELSGFTVINGFGFAGGGVKIDDCSPFINNMFFVDCEAATDGGAVVVIGRNAVPLIEGCMLNENMAGLDGGAIAFMDGARGVVSQCSMDTNRADGNGGAVSSDQSDPLILNVTLLNNSAECDGGAIWYNGPDSRPQGGITLVDMINNVAGKNGGGLWMNLSVPFDDQPFSFVTAEGNVAEKGGGGWLFLTFVLTADEFMFMDNCAGEGGGLWAEGGADMQLNLIGPVFEDNEADGDGGGLHIDGEGETTISGGSISGNRAGGNGGGVAVEGSGDVTIEDTEIDNNEADGNGGGGWFDLPTPMPADVDIDASSFNNNTSGSCGGNVYWNGPHSTLTIHDSTIGHGTANLAGGLYSTGNSHTSGTLFELNTAAFAGGAGYFGGTDTATGNTYRDDVATGFGGNVGVDGATLLISESVLEGGCAGDSGGGIAASSGATVVAEDLIVRECKGTNGGGVFASNLEGDEGIAGIGSAFVNCQFIDNTATDLGGAIYNASSAYPITGCLFAGNTGARGGAMANSLDGPTMTNCTLTENTATNTGGAMFNSGFASPLVHNSILWSNVPNEIHHLSGNSTVRFSNVQGGLPSAWDAGNNIDAPPLFVDAPARDWRLQSGSPCVDAADNTLVPADGTDVDDNGDVGETLPFDLDEHGRFADDLNTRDTGVAGNGYDAVVDMGAYELFGAAPTCPWDLANDDSAINAADLAQLLDDWGPNPASPADFTGDGLVDAADLAQLLDNWGPCP